MTVHNGTAAALRGAQDLDGETTSFALDPHGDSILVLNPQDGRMHRLHVQIPPGGPEFSNVVTLLVTAEHGAPASVVGQAFVGAV